MRFDKKWLASLLILASACSQGTVSRRQQPRTGTTTAATTSIATVATRTTPATTAVPVAPVATKTTTVAPSTSAATPVASNPTEVVPLILIHGHGSDPEAWKPFLEKLGQGREVVPEMYAGEADALKAGDLPRGCIVSAGYYREAKGAVLYDLDAQNEGHGSMGGCPVPRGDGHAGRYTVSYVERIARIVDGVRRATGSDRVDLALHSMGNIVGRAYTRWHGDLPSGQSKVRRMLCIVGPQRGVNALEAMVDGLEYAKTDHREFMLLGEDSELCYEYKVYQGKSYIDLLNDDWDGFCAKRGIVYAGVSAAGAHGNQVDPNGGAPFKLFGLISLSGPYAHIGKALSNITAQSFNDAMPYVARILANPITEYKEALGPGDGTVRFASSRMDQAPFLGAQSWVEIEARHGSSWNPEQGAHVSTFTTELARQFLFSGKVDKSAKLAKAELKLVDVPGKASFLCLETSVTGGSLVAAQIVEEKLDAQGKPTGGALGYACPLPEGEQRAMIPVTAGGGDRRYHLVAYSAVAAVSSKDVSFKLVDGPLVAAPSTSFVSATATVTGPGTIVHATFASNVPSNEPTLRFSFRIDGGAWTSYDASPTFDSAALSPGEHRLEARSRHATITNANTPFEDARGVSVGLVVDAQGNLTVRK